MSEYNVDIDALYSCLKDGLVRVRFIKVDGSERLMECSLSDSYIPASPPLPEGTVKKERKVSDDVIRVYELGSVNAWRSFRKDSVIDYQVLSEVKTFE